MPRRVASIACMLSLVCVSLAHADPRADRPQTPSRTAVVEAMRGVSATVSACGNGWQGPAPTRIVFSGASGRVTSVRVADSVPPNVARCVERAVSSARVPPFRAEQFSVNYPFRL